MKTLITVQGDIEALVIKQLLESSGVPVTFGTQIDHSLFPLTVDGLGAVDIQVNDEDYEEARKLLEAEGEYSGEEPGEMDY